MNKIEILDINPYGIPMCDELKSIVLTQKVVDYRGTAIVEDAEIENRVLKSKLGRPDLKINIK
ncbi:MAG: hypothetical protein PHT69_02360 [Bacteroidales bacterium]|nr:hypothetical protein [Bacteroidales bacterium]